MTLIGLQSAIDSTLRNVYELRMQQAIQRRGIKSSQIHLRKVQKWAMTRS